MPFSDTEKLRRFRKAIEQALDGEGYMPPELGGDPLVLRVRMLRKDIARQHQKAMHGCYDFHCPDCDLPIT